MDNFNKQIKKYHTLYTEGPIWNKVKNAAGAAGTRVWDTAKTNAKKHLQNWKDEATRGGKNIYMNREKVSSAVATTNEKSGENRFGLMGA